MIRNINKLYLHPRTNIYTADTTQQTPHHLFIITAPKPTTIPITTTNQTSECVWVQRLPQHVYKSMIITRMSTSNIFTHHLFQTSSITASRDFCRPQNYHLQPLPVSPPLPLSPTTTTANTITCHYSILSQYHSNDINTISITITTTSTTSHCHHYHSTQLPLAPQTKRTTKSYHNNKRTQHSPPLTAKPKSNYYMPCEITVVDQWNAPWQL